jgi:muramoyltetrapeptide carboxypeptidase
MQRRRLLQGAASLVFTAAALSRQQAHAGGGDDRPVPSSPPPLRPGSRIAAVATGTWMEPGDGILALLRQRCRDRGWTLLTPPELDGRWRWFSGRDPVRLQALRQAWLDPQVDAIACVGAGWGSARVLELGWRIPASPRWCIGFSDCSALLLAQLAAGSHGGIHGSLGGSSPQWQRLADLLEGLSVSPLQGRPQRPGIAEGPLVVSNLTIATSLIGTPWMPDLRGTVLVLEDTGEAPYRIDRQLTQWRSSGLLRGVAGIGLGRFSWARDDVLPGDFSMEEILLERLGDLGIPLISDLAVGHGAPNLALPLGRRVRLDGATGLLDLLPS